MIQLLLIRIKDKEKNKFKNKKINNTILSKRINLIINKKKISCLQYLIVTVKFKQNKINPSNKKIKNLKKEKKYSYHLKIKLYYYQMMINYEPNHRLTYIQIGLSNH